VEGFECGFVAWGCVADASMECVYGVFSHETPLLIETKEMMTKAEQLLLFATKNCPRPTNFEECGTKIYEYDSGPSFLLYSFAERGFSECIMCPSGSFPQYGEK